MYLDAAGTRTPLRSAARRFGLGRGELSDGVVTAALGVMLLVGLWLRTRQLGAHFWVDEGISVGIASHPLGAIPGLLREDGSPPLYYVLLHGWMELFGRGVRATHVLSLLFAMLSVPAAYWSASRLWTRREGLVCAALAATLPYLTTYAQETRMYALATLLGLLVSFAFLQVYVRRRRGYLPLFSLALAGGLYTHNWALFLTAMALPAFLLCVGEAAPDARRDLWRDGLIGFGAAGLLYLPWLPTLIYQTGHTGAPWDLPPVIWSLSQGLYALVGGRGAACALLLGGGAGLAALRHSGASTLRGRTLPRLPLEVECLLILGLGTLLLGWAYSKLSPAWAIRYLAVIVGPLLLAFGLGLARARTLGAVSLALLLLWWLLAPVPGNLNFKSNVAVVARQAAPALGANPLVLSTQPEQVPVIHYYLPRVRRFGTLLGPTPDPGVTDWRGALERLERSSVRGVLMPMLRRVAPGQRVLIVLPANIAPAPLYMKLIRDDSRVWTRALESDRAFRRVGVYTRAMFSGGVDVEALLFQRVR